MLESHFPLFIFPLDVFHGPTWFRWLRLALAGLTTFSLPLLACIVLDAAFL